MMWLDVDFAGGRSRYSRGKRLASAVREATKLLEQAPEGQIGIYDTPRGDGFHGYVIKYPGDAPFFEAAESEATR